MLSLIHSEPYGVLLHYRWKPQCHSLHWSSQISQLIYSLLAEELHLSQSVLLHKWTWQPDPIDWIAIEQGYHPFVDWR